MKKEDLLLLFKEQFGYVENARVFFAPGRVNLIGEHLDYNGGHVFPAALTFGTWAVAAPRDDWEYNFRSENIPLPVSCSAANDIHYKKEDDWANYPKGVLKELKEHYPDGAFTGADILFYGNIPNGAGLSSSASIELAAGLAFSRLAGLEVPILELVKIGQRVENHFIGVNSGIMDQFAVGMGKEGHAVALKCDSLSYVYIPVDITGYKLIITNTNKRRGLADSKYNERRSECEQGLAILQNYIPNADSLGDISHEQWQTIKQHIEDETIRRRVEHVISENERVLKAMDSLQGDDLLAFGKRMKESHESLRDDYEVTGPELDALFEEASKQEGCIGTRMTGAGFGGCSISLVKEEAVDVFIKEVGEKYEKRIGLKPSFYIAEIGGGAREI
ncbi:galactokinase [Neobacillus notoginsengisoli]|uniref:Galactokinase n=1 Tax=Neobacillus notoginsengisoli TaxID=1578198 RepID=A0A417YYT0_9BACI|nr:galactokinase [Neobacillus notoginsengisoli]RHW42687.1 galactokinase [Neobacillus notoginsengisoli]